MEGEPKPQLKEYGNWQKVDLQKEGGELLRTLKLAYGEDFTIDQNKEFFRKIVDSYDSTELQVLDDRIWLQLENTDSWDIPIGDMERVEKTIGETRDWATLKDSFKKNNSMEAPIIGHLPDGKYHLISGNTRLSVARASFLRPKVIIIEFPNFN